MVPRYWAFVTKTRLDDDFRAACIDIDATQLTPEKLVMKLSVWFPTNHTVLLDKRPISAAEYIAWEQETDRFAEEEAAYLDGLREDPPTW